MQRSEVRKAWATAIAVSLLVHVLILAVFFRDWSARLPVFRETSIEVSLTRPERPPSEPPPRPVDTPLPRLRPTTSPSPATVAPIFAPVGEQQAVPAPLRPPAPAAPRAAPDGMLARAIPPDPRRKDCKDATMAELFGSRLRECEYVIEEVRAKLGMGFTPGAVPPALASLPDGGTDPRARADFDKGKQMRNCLVPHPQGGCLKDQGLVLKRKF